MTSSMALPRISMVVRTCAGRQGMLREAVASVLSQTWRPLELVVVEDGSDSAADWLKSLPPSPGVSIVYRSLPKGGRCLAGNAGFALATGEFLGLLDDDDLLWPEHASTLAAALIDRPDIVAAYALALETPTTIDDWTVPRYRTLPGYIAHRRPYSRALLMQRNYLAIQTVLFRRRLFTECGGFDAQLDQLEDWDLWRRFSQRGDFLLVPKVTSLYRVPGSANDAFVRHQKIISYRGRLFERHRFDDSHSPHSHQSLVFSARRMMGTMAHRALLANRWLFRGYWNLRRWYLGLRSERIR